MAGRFRYEGMMNLAAIINHVEDGDNAPFSYVVITFFSAIALRNFFETMVDSHNRVIDLQNIVHYSLFYFALSGAIILLLYFLTGERIERVTRTVLVSFFIIVSVPVIDLFFLLATGNRSSYLYMTPENTHSPLTNYLFFFGDHEGTTLGMRIEIFLAVVAASFYVYIKKRRFLRALVAGVMIYSLIFWIFMAAPIWLKSVEDAFGLQPDTSTRILTDFYLLLSLILYLVIAYAHFPSYLSAVVEDIRLPRVLHYELMIICGLALGYHGRRFLLPPLSSVLEFSLLGLSLLFAWVYSAITNNLADVKIDIRSNPGRPSVTGVIPQEDYKRMANVAFILAVVSSAAIGYFSCFLICCFIAGYFLYSMPPLRLKRVPVVSKAIIAINCLAMMLAGYGFAGQNIKTFPPRIIVLVLVFFTACINFIDIKDYEGDRAAGIKTLPVLLGMRWSKALIGTFFVITYAAFPYLLGRPSLMPAALLFGLAMFLVINRKNYREPPVFVIYLVSVVILIMIY